MENIALISVCFVCVALILIVCLYLDLDKHRFRIRRVFKNFQNELDQWVELTAQMAQTGAVDDTALVTRLATDYKATKKAEGKSDALSKLVLVELHLDMDASGEAVRLMGRRGELSEELSIFCADYNRTAEILGRRLDMSVIGKVGRLLGFRRYEKINQAIEGLENISKEVK